jgi:hypothetical protein
MEISHSCCGAILVSDLLSSRSINKMHFLVKGRTQKGIMLPFVDDKMKYWHNLSTTPKHFRDGVCLFGQSG